MKDKENQIEEMAELMYNKCQNTRVCTTDDDCDECKAKVLLEAGYRKLPEDSVANQKLFDEFVKFVKDKFNLTIVKDDTKKPITFEELFGKVFEDSVVLSREEYDKLCHLAYFGYEDVKEQAVKEFAEKLRKNLYSFKCDTIIYDSELSNLAKEIYIKQLDFIKERMIEETLKEVIGEKE